MALLAAVALRLAGLQTYWSDAYATDAVARRSVQVPLPAVRGSILDATGAPLATTVDAADIIVNQQEIDSPAATALVLSEVLGRDPVMLQRKLTGEDPWEYLVRNVPARTAAQVRAFGLPGILFEPAANRDYPSGAVAGNLLGIVGTDDNALGGVEAQYDDVLAGRPGSSSYEQDARGREMPFGERTRVDPVPGRDVRLTVDRDLQYHAEQVLARQVRASGAKGGSAVVMDTRTGAIRAIASVPVRDPRRPDALPDKRDWGLLPVELVYEPGSVQKPLTVAAALDAGVVDLDDTFRVPDQLVRDGWSVRNFDRHDTLRLTPAGILARSSNVGTVLLAERMSPEQLRETLARFGYGQTPGLGLGGEGASKLPALTPQEWSDFRHATIGYGQGLSTTAVGLASAYAALGNDGVRPPAHVVAAVVDADGTEHPVVHGQGVRVVSQQAARETVAAMESVVGPEGTGRRVVVDGYRIAGKTGTAEVWSDRCQSYECRRNIVSFAGVAPAEDPRLAVVVSLYEPVRGSTGSGTAGPVWADITRAALLAEGVPPSTEPTPDLPVYAP